MNNYFQLVALLLLPSIIDARISTFAHTARATQRILPTIQYARSMCSSKFYEYPVTDDQFLLNEAIATNATLEEVQQELKEARAHNKRSEAQLQELQEKIDTLNKTVADISQAIAIIGHAYFIEIGRLPKEEVIITPAQSKNS